MALLTIGEVARRAGVGIQTVRYYERLGLIDKPFRNDSGYRQFSEEVLGQLRFIKRAQVLGFSLREIKELLSFRDDAASNCDRVLRRLLAKISNLEQKTRQLQRMRLSLEKLARACSEATSACPVLDRLGSAEDCSCAGRI